MTNRLFKVGDPVSWLDTQGNREEGRITILRGREARVRTVQGKKRDRCVDDLLPLQLEVMARRKSIPHFSVAERFNFIRQTTTMVAQGHSPSCLITGLGGLGKTYEVISTLKSLNLTEGEDYILIKGQATAKGLFDTFTEYPDRLLVFDDCDSVLEDKVAINLLKGALDSSFARKISWYNGQELCVVTITGSVIFVTNKTMESIKQTLRSRSLAVDLSLTPEEIVERMGQLLPTWPGDYSRSQREESLALVQEYAYSVNNLNLRTLDKVLRCSRLEDDNWKLLALYHMSHD